MDPFLGAGGFVHKPPMPISWPPAKQWICSFSLEKKKRRRKNDILKGIFFRQQKLHIQVKTHRLPNAHRRPTTKGETAREAGGDPRVETLETWRMDHLFELVATFPWAFLVISKYFLNIWKIVLTNFKNVFRRFLFCVDKNCLNVFLRQFCAQLTTLNSKVHYAVTLWANHLNVCLR